MKILQIAPAWINTPPKDYGGTEWSIANLTKGLVNLGHDVTLFATKGSQTPAKLAYTFDKSFLDQNIPWSAALPAFIHYHEAFKLAKDYDIVHAHLSSGTDMMLLTFLSDLTKQGIPNLLTIHSRWPYDKYSQMDQMFLKLYGKNISSLNISKAMTKFLPDQLRHAGVLPNSINLELMKFNAKGGNYLTWIGKIIPNKGLKEAIIAAKKSKMKFIFAGVVDKFKQDSLAYFEQEIKPMIDGKQVIYLGPANLDLKNKLLGNAKAFLNLIHWEEPFGMVMIESMACGTPVIAFNRGAVPEILKHGKTGFIVKSLGEVIAAVGKVNKIDRRICRQHVESNFSNETIAKKAEEFYIKEIVRTQKNKRIYIQPVLPETAYQPFYSSIKESK